MQHSVQPQWFNTLASLKLTSAAMAQGIVQDDYKALVCIFLAGGNDSNNLLVPRGNSELRTDYQNGRGVIALSNNQLHALTVPTTTMAFDQYHDGSRSSMGIHPDAKGLQISSMPKTSASSATSGRWLIQSRIAISTLIRVYLCPRICSRIPINKWSGRHRSPIDLLLRDGGDVPPTYSTLDIMATRRRSLCRFH